MSLENQLFSEIYLIFIFLQIGGWTKGLYYFVDKSPQHRLTDINHY